MNLRNRLSSLLSVSSLSLIVFAALASGSASCGSDHACFYFTDVEYEISNACPSRQEALAFFQGDFCSTPITSVDSDGEFDGTTCCYEITESNDFSTCGFGPDTPPPPFNGVTSGVSGVGGAGGVAGAGGMGGAGGAETCAKCAAFLTNPDPPPLCADSVKLYETYTGCLCDGLCAAVCKDACASGAMPSSECVTCSIDQTNGCGAEQQACSADN